MTLFFNKDTELLGLSSDMTKHKYNAVDDCWYIDINLYSLTVCTEFSEFFNAHHFPNSIIIESERTYATKTFGLDHIYSEKYYAEYIPYDMKDNIKVRINW